MYDATEAQLNAEKALSKQGFRFSNWISANGYGADNEESGTSHGCMVLIKKVKFGREYRQIDPDGNIN